MRGSQLILSAHRSAWNAPDGGLRTRTAHLQGSCHHCGQKLHGWREPFHLNGDHDDDGQGNIVLSCPLCHLTQHLNRPAIEQEAVLAWLPEMTQRAVIALARSAHLTLFRDGVAPHVTTLPRGRGVSDAVQGAFSLLRAMRLRAARVRGMIGADSPRVLGAALLTLSAADYADRAASLGGIRLLPLGCLFSGGRDVYGDILESWS